MASEAKIQINWGPNSPIPLVNVYANSPEEEEALTAHVHRRMAIWVATGEDFRTVGTVAAAGVLAPATQQLPPSPPPAANGWGNAPTAPAAAPSAPPSFAQAAVPQCRHGERKAVSKSGANGLWKAWFCPTGKDATDKCDPIFVSQKDDPAGWANFPA